MIIVENTPNNTGVSIIGDYNDFENLYEALHVISKGENEEGRYFSGSIRVLSFCYDMRHALMGERSYEFVSNGLDNEKKRKLRVLASDSNVYLKMNVLWPEMLFLLVVMNDLLTLYAEEEARTKSSSNLYAEPKVSWNETIHHVRMLQGAVATCLQGVLTPVAYSRLLNTMNGEEVDTSYYVIQYIDFLNDRFLKMEKDKRLKNLFITAKRIAEQDREYEDLKGYLEEEARERKCNINELRLSIDYPETIEW